MAVEPADAQDTRYSLETAAGCHRHSGVKVVDPADELGDFDRLNVEVDNQSLLTTSCQHAMQLQVVAGVDFLMRHVRWDVDEASLASLGKELQPITPSQAGDSIHHIDDT